MAGDTRTGVMVMRMDEGLDTGPVALTHEIPITPQMTAGDLHDAMMEDGAELMSRALAQLQRGALTFTPQPETGVVYAAKIEKGETHIDFAAPAGVVHDHIRGLSPFPGAWLTLDLGGRPVRVKALRSAPAEGGGPPGTVLDDALTIACGEGAVRLLEVQREGRGALDAQSFLRGSGPLRGAVAH